MKVVLDASIAAAWALADEDNAHAAETLHKLRLDGAVTPTLFFYEIRNILVVNERRGRIQGKDSDAFLAALRRLPIETDTNPDEGRLMALSRKHGLSIYDASYLELSLRTGVDLATLDAKLAAAKRSEDLPQSLK